MIGQIALTLVAWVGLLAVVSVAVSTSWFRIGVTNSSNSSWSRRVGVLALLSGAISLGAFFIDPRVGLYLLIVTGVISFASGVLATARAAGIALTAIDSREHIWRRIQAFWIASRVYYRWTKWGFGLSLASFVLGAFVAGLSVDPFINAIGALALGGIFACVMSIAGVGVFVPMARNERVAEAVERVRT